MDARIAEKVMGWNAPNHADTVSFKEERRKQGSFTPANIREFWLGFNQDGTRALFLLPHYSTDIADAWQIVEKWIEDNNHDIFIEYWRDNEWFVAGKNILDKPREPQACCDGRKTGKMSAPLAICRAALKEAGVELPEYVTA